LMLKLFSTNFVPYSDYPLLTMMIIIIKKDNTEFLHIVRIYRRKLSSKYDDSYSSLKT
jgi:hypothetical protein